MKRLIIIGASGQGKVVADIAKLIGYKDIVFLDNNTEINECEGVPVMGPDTLAAELDGELFIAVGNSAIRERLMDRNSERVFPVLIHPKAVVAEDVTIGSGSVVMAGAVINPGAIIGRGAIVNTSSSIDHDCVLGDYVHVAVGAHLCGTVIVGNKTWIGAGAIISNNVNLCEECTIGAGAVVIKDLDIPGTYIGVPAELVDKNSQQSSI